LKDVGLVNSISGSLFGPPLLLGTCLMLYSFLFYVSSTYELYSFVAVVPALMNIQNSKKTPEKSYGIGNRKSTSTNPVNKLEMAINYAMIPIGMVLTVISLMITLQKA
jgi:TRAP-type C4-dicarboxylate transport system permease small subunit